MTLDDLRNEVQEIINRPHFSPIWIEKISEKYRVSQSADLVLGYACKSCGTTRRKIFQNTGTKNPRNQTLATWFFYWWCREHTKLSLSEMSAFLERTHSTACISLQALDDELRLGVNKDIIKAFRVFQVKLKGSEDKWKANL